jgi:hypothetical protein
MNPGEHMLKKPALNSMIGRVMVRTLLCGFLPESDIV